MTAPSSSRIHPPWTERTVRFLNLFQVHGGMHPFTCPRTGSNLIATLDGWTCPTCSYNQTWAHAFMADPTAWPQFGRTITVNGDAVTITRGRQYEHHGLVDDGDDRWWRNRYDDLTDRVHRALVPGADVEELYLNEPVFNLHVKMTAALVRALDDALRDGHVPEEVRDRALDRALFGDPDHDPRRLAETAQRLTRSEPPFDLGLPGLMDEAT